MSGKDRAPRPRRRRGTPATGRTRNARPPAWPIDELARRAGVPVRTVRYYLTRGLLPAPAFRGPNTTYGAEHLARLEAIQRLQADYLPLDAIARALDGRTLEELGRLAREGLAPVVGAAPAAPAPSPARGSGAAPAAAQRVLRWRLANGLELALDEGAPAASRRLAERIRDLVAPET